MPSLASLPTWLSWWFGYRSTQAKPKKPLPSWRVWFWSFIGAWLGIAILEVVFIYGPGFLQYDASAIVPSFGASAVLLYGAIDSPLAQPRNAFCGHVVGAVVGVIINTLFVQLAHFSSPAQQIAVRWVAGATAMALTLVISQILKVVHPPAGATALIAVVSDSSVQEGWFYVAHVVISISLQLVVAVLVNNIEKLYPVYWWTPRPSTTPIPALPISQSHDTLGMAENGVTGQKMLADDDEATQIENKLILLPDRPFAYPPNLLLDPQEEVVLKQIQAKLAALHTL
ncbi:hypothetical protein EC973_003478 [Apophysomyces ossiformis]|uniref:HPP transmembrane region domain-containing protein n=1 Tax=Apophysomyces ossiformis TaxID=679940 RepID=A0A8H7BJI0_9FUNG|nr:hypothetical protein EC973_003478 [Apophysomyces ossiformis]